MRRKLLRRFLQYCPPKHEELKAVLEVTPLFSCHALREGWKAIAHFPFPAGKEARLTMDETRKGEE